MINIHLAVQNEIRLICSARDTPKRIGWGWVGLGVPGDNRSCYRYGVDVAPRGVMIINSDRVARDKSLWQMSLTLPRDHEAIVTSQREHAQLPPSRWRLEICTSCQGKVRSLCDNLRLIYVGVSVHYCTIHPRMCVDFLNRAVFRWKYVIRHNIYIVCDC